jgi:hypothetical protein
MHPDDDNPLDALTVKTPAFDPVALAYLSGTVPTIVQPATPSLQLKTIVPLVMPLVTGDIRAAV